MRLYVDIETYSSVPLSDSGVYKYTESIDFDILLIAYAFDDGEVKIIDLARGDGDEYFFQALTDPSVEKWAHNAMFERVCFRAYGYDAPAEQWFCSAIKAAYCGLPFSLEKISSVMQLEEKGKLATGRALVKFFCVPCKPKKTNGYASFNRPDGNEDKWFDFISYCVNDVVAMREIVVALDGHTISDFERSVYALDQKINDTGVEVDLLFTRKAFDMNAIYVAGLLDRMKELTEMENPNSLPQLKNWLLKVTGKEIKSLTKDTIPALINEFEEEAILIETEIATIKEVLSLKGATSKTSIAKYSSMLNCAGRDSRARGLFQFYGANRTGRWAGRLIQLQNLTRNHITDLEGARGAVYTKDTELINILHGETASILSQLVRTALVAKEGCIFAVADFAAIEARVTAWIAREEWRMGVFNTDGKIYEASAAMMFGVDIEEVTKGSDYRSKGKIAELALGYGGSLGALIKMGGEDMGLSEKEMQSLVYAWRRKSPAVVSFWGAVNDLSKRAVKNPGSVFEYCAGDERNLKFQYDTKALTIELPSGRKLFYAQPSFSLDRWGRESIKYMGLVKGQWIWVDTYGGKLTENIVQGVARDLLAFSMLNLDKAGFDICMHIHDESVCEVDVHGAEDSLAKMNSIMGERPEWAKELPLVADGYITPFYKKD